MARDRGKQFEKGIFDQIKKLPQVSILRLYDNMGGFKSVANICDFIVYKHPLMVYMECKVSEIPTLNFEGRITQTQWDGLYEHGSIQGVQAGVLVWFINEDLTVFATMKYLHQLANSGEKSLKVSKIRASIECNTIPHGLTIVNGKKKRLFYEYDFEALIKTLKEKIHD